MSVGMGAISTLGNVDVSETTQSNSNNVDTSRSATIGNTSDYSEAGSIVGADLNLSESSGNVFNLADPALTTAAAGIAQSSLLGAFTGLERITEASNMAVKRSLDLAEVIQGGEGRQVLDLGRTAFYSLAAVAGVAVAAFIFKPRRKKKAK